MTKDPNTPPRPGRGVLKKGALAGLMIVLLTATTVASAALLEVDQLVNIVRAEGQTIPGVANALDNVDGGGPQTMVMSGRTIVSLDTIRLPKSFVPACCGSALKVVRARGPN